MKARQQDRSGRGRLGDKAKARPPQTLRAHPAFAPILGVWGALLGGLVVLVLPVGMINDAFTGTGFAGLGSQVQWLLATFAALFMGGSLYLIAGRFSVKPQALDESREMVRAVSSFLRPIDPVNDLGSPSFDAPLAEMPFPARPASPTEAAQEKVQPVTATAAEPPRELDLAQFAELPGRNAVWVEEVMAEPRQDPVTAEAPAPVSPKPAPAPEPVPVPAPVPPSATALARLRAVPP